MSEFQALADHLNSTSFFSGGYISFDSIEDAQKALNEMDDNIRAIKTALNEKMFDDAYTENAMIQELTTLENDADELALLILQIKTENSGF